MEQIRKFRTQQQPCHAQVEGSHRDVDALAHVSSRTKHKVVALAHVRVGRDLSDRLVVSCPPEGVEGTRLEVTLRIVLYGPM